MAEALKRCVVCLKLHKPHCGNAQDEPVTHTGNAQVLADIEAVRAILDAQPVPTDGRQIWPPLTPAQKQRAYRQRHQEAVRAANAARMRKVRAK